MSQVSHQKLLSKTWNILWHHFLSAIKNLRSDDDIDNILSGILTESEQIMIAKRMMVSILLLSDWEPVAIAEAIKLSRSSVYKYVDEFKLNEPYRNCIKNLFPEKIPFDNAYKRVGFLEKFLDNLYEGYFDRKKLYQNIYGDESN